MKTNLIIYWSRRDFRLRDNNALYQAAKYSEENNILFLPIFIIEDYMQKSGTDFQFGLAQREILTRSLPNFSNNFKKDKSEKKNEEDNFYITLGKPTQIFEKLSKIYNIKIFVNDDVYIDFYKQIENLKNIGLDVCVCDDAMSVNKNTKTGTDNLYSVFTPFKKNVWAEFLNKKEIDKIDTTKINYINKAETEEIKREINILENNTEENIRKIFDTKRIFAAGNNTFDIAELLGDIKIDFDAFLYDEEKILSSLDVYTKQDMENYKSDRDSLEKNRTSRMSTYLAWGLISPRTIKNKIQKHFDYDFLNALNIISDKYTGPTIFISELIWREFYKYLMYHKPYLMHTEFQEKFRGTIKWVDDETAKHRFTSWIKGDTGYKIVDAAMMELARTGVMHNRSRMIVASVLTKNFGVDWRWGQEYFRAMLMDLDEASNNGGWQWGASVGADPKPIRIFNPYLQAENYDASNAYQKKWLTQDRYYFEMPPIIEHKIARDEALSRYNLKSGGVRDY